MPQALTQKQLLFINEYVKDGNGKRSATSAGYSAKNAESIASKLLKHPPVAAELALRAVDSKKNAQLNAEMVVETLRGLVSFDIASIYTDDGKLRPISEIPIEARNAIASIDGNKVKLISRLGSAELAAKLLGMVKEQQTQQQAVQITIAAPAARPEVSVDVKRLVPEWDT